MKNAHVLQWYRWQHFMAHRQHRFLAMLYWATQHNAEMENTNDTQH